MKTTTLSIEFKHGTEFNDLIAGLSEKFQPLQIFCFYKRNSSATKMSCFNDECARSQYEYALLLITDTAVRIDYEVQDYANSHYKKGLLTVICHSNQSIWEAIDANSRFFKTIYSAGELLYCHSGLLTKPYISPYNPTKAGIKAAKHYNHRFPLIESFMVGAQSCLEKGHYTITPFMLHQAVEQACICLIRVHIAYRSEFHNLKRLLSLCNCFSERPYNLFLSNPKDERLFEIMSKSYSSARYKDGFTVSQADAEGLYTLVTSFIDLTKIMCEEKINLLNIAANEYHAQNRDSKELITANVSVTIE